MAEAERQGEPQPLVPTPRISKDLDPTSSILKAASQRDPGMLTLKQRTWVFMEDNAVINALILLVIIFSTTCFVLETSFKEDELRVMWFGCARGF